MDMFADKLGEFMSHPRFHFFEGDITINQEWIEYHVKKCDVVLPLVAIATRQPMCRRRCACSSWISKPTCRLSNGA